MRFDLLIKGGELVDPGAGREGPLDVAVVRDRVAAVDRDIPADSARRVIDASGQIVTPGLVDLHAHVFHGVTYWGIRPDPIASRTGVTTWADAGSAGALTLPGFREFVVDPSRVRIRSFLHISSIGLVGENYESANLELCDVDIFSRLADLNRDLVVGVKVRMGAPTNGPHGVEPLRRAIEAGRRCDLPVMVHIALGPPTIDDVIELMRPGDILTHCFTGHDMRIVDDSGALRDSARRAIDAGLILDVGHGTGSFSFAVAEGLLAAGVRPDAISSDMHQLSVSGPMFDLPTTMSKFLALGMSLPEVVAATTVRPATVLGLADEVGTLRPGAHADIALFHLLEGSFPFYDISGDTRAADRLLRNTLTIVGGRELHRVEPAPLAPWVAPSWPATQLPFTEKQQRLRDLGHTPDAMAAAAEASARA